MIRRFALVTWWLGALLGAGLIVAGIVEGVRTGRLDSTLAISGGGALMALPFWALAFVLSGSFWRPPQ